MTKKVKGFFELDQKTPPMTRGDKEKFLNNVVLHLADLKSWDEAKVTGGGVKLNELTNTFESKKVG